MAGRLQTGLAAPGKATGGGTVREDDKTKFLSVIANLCFISGKTNRQISDKAPADYFPSLVEKAGEAAFQAQCIPVGQEFLSLPSYKAFVAERRKQIAARLNEFLGGEAKS